MCVHFIPSAFPGATRQVTETGSKEQQVCEDTGIQRAGAGSLHTYKGIQRPKGHTHFQSESHQWKSCLCIHMHNFNKKIWQRNKWCIRGGGYAERLLL